MTTSGSNADQGEAYAAYVSDLLTREYQRRERLDTRSNVVSTSGVALTGLAVALGGRPVVPGSAPPSETLTAMSTWSYVAAAAFALVSAVLGVIGGRLTTYSVLDDESITKLLTRDWGDKPAVARSKVAQFNAATIRHLRVKLTKKANTLASALLCSGISLTLLLLALILSMLSNIYH